MSRRSLVRKIQRIVDHAVPQLGLGDWTVVVLEDPCDDSCHAEVHKHWENKTAEIRVSKNYAELTEELQRLYAIHELTHLRVACLRSTAEKIIEGIVGALLDSAEETDVEAISKTLARGLRAKTK